MTLHRVSNCVCIVMFSQLQVYQYIYMLLFQYKSDYVSLDSQHEQKLTVFLLYFITYKGTIESIVTIFNICITVNFNLNIVTGRVIH